MRRPARRCGVWTIYSWWTTWSERRSNALRLIISLSSYGSPQQLRKDKPARQWDSVSSWLSFAPTLSDYESKSDTYFTQLFFLGNGAHIYCQTIRKVFVGEKCMSKKYEKSRHRLWRFDCSLLLTFLFATESGQKLYFVIHVGLVEFISVLSITWYHGHRPVCAAGIWSGKAVTGDAVTCDESWSTYRPTRVFYRQEHVSNDGLQDSTIQYLLTRQ